jgi:hypothetical protein
MFSRYKSKLVKIFTKRDRDGNPVSRRDVVAVYKAILRRPPTEEQIKGHVRSRIALRLLIRSLMATEEFCARNGISREFLDAGPEYHRHNGIGYFSPTELRTSDAAIPRVLLVGRCFLECWPGKLKRDGIQTPIGYLLLSSRPPSLPPRPIADYAFQIGQIPLRLVLFDSDYAEWVRAPFGDHAATQKLLEQCYARIDFLLDRLLIWSDRIPMFVTNF